jgi:hypothetical protein
MLDDKRLDDMERVTRETFATLKPTSGTEAMLQSNHLNQSLELIRLARLGLWAETHQQAIRDCLGGCSGDFCPGGEKDAASALAAMPKTDVHAVFLNPVFITEGGLACVCGGTGNCSGCNP